MLDKLLSIPALIQQQRILLSTNMCRAPDVQSDCRWPCSQGAGLPPVACLLTEELMITFSSRIRTT